MFDCIISLPIYLSRLAFFVPMLAFFSVSEDSLHFSQERRFFSCPKLKKEFQARGEMPFQKSHVPKIEKSILSTRPILVFFRTGHKLVPV